MIVHYNNLLKMYIDIYDYLYCTFDDVLEIVPKEERGE